MAPIGEGEGEDAGGGAIVANRREWRRSRCAPRSVGWKTRAAPGASGGEPDIALSEQGEAAIAGGEGSLVGQARLAELRRCQVAPPSSVVKYFGAAFQRIAHHDAVLRIPEGDGVEEALWDRVGELQRPVLAGVAGFIDARFVAGAGTHQIDGMRVDGLDAAEIQGFCAGDLAARHVAPPSVVASQVPPLPLAHTVRASTALTPRSEARVLLFAGVHSARRSWR